MINPAHQNFFGLVEMTVGLVHAGYSFPEWQAVKLTFFAPCVRVDVSVWYLLAFWGFLLCILHSSMVMPPPTSNPTTNIMRHIPAKKPLLISRSSSVKLSKEERDKGQMNRHLQPTYKHLTFTLCC